MKKTFLLFALIFIFLFHGCSSVSMEKPPALTITYNDNSIEALRGAYSWHHSEKITSVDALHALQSKELMPYLNKAPSTDCAILKFAVEPQSILVRRWGEESWGDISAKCEYITIEANTLPLTHGNYIYEISANFGPSGTANYSFYTSIDKG